MSSKDTNEKRVIHLESDNLDIMIGKKNRQSYQQTF